MKSYKVEIEMRQIFRLASFTIRTENISQLPIIRRL